MRATKLCLPPRSGAPATVTPNATSPQQSSAPHISRSHSPAASVPVSCTATSPPSSSSSATPTKAFSARKQSRAVPARLLNARLTRVSSGPAWDLPGSGGDLCGVPELRRDDDDRAEHTAAQDTRLQVDGLPLSSALQQPLPPAQWWRLGSGRIPKQRLRRRRSRLGRAVSGREPEGPEVVVARAGAVGRERQGRTSSPLPGRGGDCCHCVRGTRTSPRRPPCAAAPALHRAARARARRLRPRLPPVASFFSCIAVSKSYLLTASQVIRKPDDPARAGSKRKKKGTDVYSKKYHP